MRVLALFLAFFVPAFDVLPTGWASAQIVTIPASDVSSWGSPGPCPPVTRHTAIPNCEIDGPYPEAYAWQTANESDVSTFVAFTVVTIYNTAAGTSRISTVYNKPPDGFTMPDTNSDGTRVWTLTYTRLDTPSTTVVTYPTPFVDWPDYYSWSGVMSFTQPGGNASTTQCIHQVPLGTADPLPPTKRYLTATPPVTDMRLVNSAKYTADPHGLNHWLQSTGGLQDPYFIYGSLFSGEPPLTQCVGAAILPGARQGRWAGDWFIETTSSTSYEEETATTEEGTQGALRLGPATSTDGLPPPPPPPSSTSTRRNDAMPPSTSTRRETAVPPSTSMRREDDVPTSTRAPAPIVPTTTKTKTIVQPSSTADGPGPASSSTVRPGTESQTRTVSETSHSQAAAFSRTSVDSQATTISQTSAKAQRKTASTESGSAGMTVVNVVQPKPIILIPVVRSTLVTTNEDGSLMTVVAFVQDEEAMLTQGVDSPATMLRAQTGTSLEDAASEETAMVQSTDGNVQRSAAGLETRTTSSSDRPDPGSNHQTAGGAWHRPGWAMLMLTAMVIALV